jgi:hypothetical protein
MALNKFETEIKNQLNSREIQPSAQGWDRLDAMLSITEKPKKKFPWLLIAASFIGFMFVGTMVYRSNNVFTITDETSNSIVTSSAVEMQNQNMQTPNVVVSSSAVEMQNQNSQMPNVVVTSNSDEVQNNNNQSNSQIQNKINLVVTNKVVTNNSKKASNDNHQLTIKEGVSITNQNQIAVNQKQEITNQTSSNQEVLSKNTDEILALVKPKVTSKTSLKVNPASLLSQVDGEVTTEFRENVFTKVSKNFQTVKVALTERNNTK